MNANIAAETTEPVAGYKLSNNHRPLNVGGAYSLTAAIVAAADRPNPEEPISMLHSWLPFPKSNLDPKGPAGYRHPGVIPTVQSLYFTRVAPILDAYCAQQNWVMQPAMFFYRPQALIDLVGEDGLVRDLIQLNKETTLQDRIYIDVTAQNQAQVLFRDMLEMLVETLKEGHIALPSYVSARDSRIAVGSLLKDYNFLVHHVFNAYPNLHVLRHRAVLDRREEFVSHIRYRRREAFGLDTEKLFRKHEINVVL